MRHVARYEYSVEVDFTDQLKAPTQTDAPDLDDIFASRRHHDDDDDSAAATPGSATASGSESTADESSESSDSD